MLYYSYISKRVVTEVEAYSELITTLVRWFNWARPNGNFDSYIQRHPDRISLGSNTAFFEQMDEDSIDSIA